MIGVDQLPGRVNYWLGDDPSRWRTNVPTYARARATSLYRGIDIEYYGAADLLEYDLIVRPGSSIDAIRLAITGATNVTTSETGDLVFGERARTLLRKPVAYQMVDHARQEISVEYRWRDDGTLGFIVGRYDHRRPLVIDPILEYSFTFGGSGADRALDLAVDDIGAVYIGGITYSSDFPNVNPADPRERRQSHRLL